MEKQRFERIEIIVGNNGYLVREPVYQEHALSPTPYVFETIGALQDWLESRLKEPTDPDVP